MKNKYFGDIRDLFKYDLIECIMRGICSLHGFTFIPMLTKDDDGKREKEEITKNLPPIYISDNEIILFLLTRTSSMRNNLVKIITKYKECYKNYEKLIVEIK